MNTQLRLGALLAATAAVYFGTSAGPWGGGAIEPRAVAEPAGGPLDFYVSWENVTPDAAAEMGLVTRRIYLHVPERDNSVLLIGFVDAWTNDPLGFFHSPPPFNSDTPSPEELFEVEPTLEYDSWVTLGENPADVQFDARFSSEEFNTNGHIIGGWYDGNPGTPVLPDENGRVLIAQLTIRNCGFLFAGVATVFVNPGTTSAGFGLAPTLAQVFPPAPCFGDFNILGGGDCVNAFDLAALLGAWGEVECHQADLNVDGVVNAGDLALLLGAWGPCPEHTGTSCFDG